jgi:hypothetical protein
MFKHSWFHMEVRNYTIDKEAVVIKKNELGWTSQAIMVFLIALVIGLTHIHSSLAGCGGYCEARQARAMCHHAVRAQELQAQARDAEFEKCKADPASYLHLDRLADDANMGVE